MSRLVGAPPGYVGYDEGGQLTEAIRRRPYAVILLDEIVRFSALQREDIRRIVDIQLRRLEERLAARRIVIEVSDAARSLLATEGYDPAFGARPLKRVIQRELGDRVASAILEGTIGEGETLWVDAADGELTLTST